MDSFFLVVHFLKEKYFNELYHVFLELSNGWKWRVPISKKSIIMFHTLTAFYSVGLPILLSLVSIHCNHPYLCAHICVAEGNCFSGMSCHISHMRTCHFLSSWSSFGTSRSQSLSGHQDLTYNLVFHQAILPVKQPHVLYKNNVSIFFLFLTFLSHVHYSLSL